MAYPSMVYSPTDGLKNHSSFPTFPVDENAWRKQFQDMFDQITTYVNSSLVPSLVASNVPSNAIAGMTSLFVQDALAELKSQMNIAVSGAIIDGSILDSKFSTTNLSTPQYKVTTNSGNAYSVAVNALASLIDGFPLCVKFNATSTGAITVNPNGLGNYPVVDYYGTAITNVRANLIANLRYDSVNGNFQLLGRGGGGNTIASHVLLNDTCSVNSGPIIGTMPNKTGSATVYTVSTVDQAVAIGYTDGATGSVKVKGEASLLASNIVTGIVIGAVTGTATIVSLGGKRYAAGSLIGVSNVAQTTSLTFQPSIIEVTFSGNTYVHDDNANLNLAYILGTVTSIGCAHYTNGFYANVPTGITCSYKAWE